jgi:predicted kinase
MSAQPLLVVIHGAPGVGKTTLCRELTQRVKLPALSKDHIKEDLLYKRLEQSDRAFSRIEGEAAVMMLYAFANTFLKKGRSVIIENAFYAEVSRNDMQQIITANNAKFLEVFCHADETVRVERFARRVESGERHPGHLDSTIKPYEGLENYAKLGLGDSIDVDTTGSITDDVYQKIAKMIAERMGEEG